MSMSSTSIRIQSVLMTLAFMAKELQGGDSPIAASPDWETHRPSQDSEVIAAHAGVEKCDSYFQCRGHCP